MAKRSKSRKSSKSKRAQRRPSRPAATTASPTGTASGTSQAATVRQRGTATRAAVDFAQEYAYVYTDLKRVAVIAAAMLVILVVLAFVLA